MKETRFNRVDARLRKLGDPVVLGLALAVTALLSVLQVVETAELPLVEFLIVPVAVASWLVHRARYGLCVALAAAAAGLGVTLAEEASHALGPALLAGAARLVLYLAVVFVFVQMRTIHDKQRKDALTDDLTGVQNARGFRLVAGCEIARAERYGHPVSVLYLDVDDFKTVNDAFGHAAGDRVLAQTGHVLRCSVRIPDTVARLGGDEFVVLMPETDEVDALAAAVRLQAELARVTSPDGSTLHHSCGLATFLDPPAGVDHLLHEADRLMYKAKAAGKDRVECSTCGERGGIKVSDDAP